MLCSVRSQVLAQQSSFKTGFSLSSLSLSLSLVYTCMHVCMNIFNTSGLRELYKGRVKVRGTWREERERPT